MRAEDLQISDWVDWNTYTIKHDYTQITHVQVDTRLEDSYNFDCEPILLNDDILKLNGWVTTYTTDMMVVWYNENIELPFRLHRDFYNDGYWLFVGETIFVNIQYVHELQHFMRDCHFIDEANNFKLTI